MDQPIDIIYVDSERVACDGGAGALGHPRVWFSLEKSAAVDCPYCGRRYVRQDAAQSPPPIVKASAQA